MRRVAGDSLLEAASFAAPRTVCSASLRASVLRDAELHRRRGELLDEPEHVGRAARRDRGHRIEQPLLGDPDHLADRARMLSAFSFSSALTSGSAYRPVMPAPISAGVFGMQRTSLRCPPSQRDSVSQREAGGDADHELLRTRCERSERALHVLRLHREDQDVGALHRRVRRGRDVHRVARAELLARRRAQLDHRDRARVGALRDQPADQRARHVAAAEEGDLHAALFLLLRADRRSRCRCAPSSRLRRSRARGRRTCPSTACRSRTRPFSFSKDFRLRGSARAVAPGSGIAISPRSRRPRQRRDRRGKRSDRRGATPLLLASPETFTWISTLSGASAAGRCSDSRRAIFSLATVCTQSKRSAASAGLVALERSDQVPFEALAGKRVHLLHALPARSSRRRPSGRPRRPAARAPTA